MESADFFRWVATIVSSFIVFGVAVWSWIILRGDPIAELVRWVFVAGCALVLAVIWWNTYAAVVP